MQTVTAKTFARKTTESFQWETVSDVNQFGRVEVRDTRTNRCFTVTVR